MSVMVSEQLYIGCGQCEPVCPEKAVRVWGIARVEEERCIECLVCLYAFKRENERDEGDSVEDPY